MPSLQVVKVMASESCNESNNIIWSGNGLVNFPEKLMMILNEKDNDSAIAWNHDGTEFSIRDRNLLCAEILPRYFESKIPMKYEAFARRLRRWKFTRTSRGLDTRIYYHPRFHRDKPGQCVQISQRNRTKKIKKQSKLEKASPQTPEKIVSESNFSSISTSMLSYEYDRLLQNRVSLSLMMTKLRYEANFLYNYPLPKFVSLGSSNMILSKE